LRQPFFSGEFMFVYANSFANNDATIDDNAVLCSSV